MKLHSITVSEVIGLARADIKFSGVNLIAADNAAGKSTLADCISMAFLGTPSRVSLKKELDQLLHEGAEKGRVSVLYDGGETGAEFRLPKGEHHADEIPGQQFLPCVLRPSKFAEITPDERRTMLFQLTGCKASSKVIIEKLVERGINEKLAEDFAINWKTGFPAAAKEAYTRATTAKGAWQQVTGQKWGSIVAEGWKAEAPTGIPTDDDLEEAFQSHEKVSKEVERGTQYLGGLQAQVQSSASYAQRKQAAQDLAEQLPRRQAKQAATEKMIQEWEPKLADMQARLATMNVGAEPVECPCCKAALKIVGSTLEVFQGSKGDSKKRSDLALELSKARAAADLVKTTLTKDIASVAEAQAAVTQLEAINAEKVEIVDEARIEKIKLALQQQKDKAQELRKAYNDLLDIRDAAKNLDSTTKNAIAAHADVKCWLAVGDALSPDGIPAELLQNAMAPFNQSLALLAGLCGWKSPSVAEDMMLRYGSRLYGLCSASEQWRANALIALAIAQISGIRIAVLDGFDILHMRDRQALLGMLIELDRIKSMDTTIMCGTMKELPKSLPPQVAGVWISKAIAENA